MAQYKIQAVNRHWGYRTPVMYVDAASEGAASRLHRLSDFPNDWSIVVNKKDDGSRSRMPRPENNGCRAKRRAVREKKGITTVSRPVRRRKARLDSKLKRYAEDKNPGKNKPGCAKHW